MTHAQMIAMLDAATSQHFAHLFQVLMSGTDDAAFERFASGLGKLLETRERTLDLINQQFEEVS